MPIFWDIFSRRSFLSLIVFHSRCCPDSASNLGDTRTLDVNTITPSQSRRPSGSTRYPVAERHNPTCPAATIAAITKNMVRENTVEPAYRRR